MNTMKRGTTRRRYTQSILGALSIAALMILIPTCQPEVPPSRMNLVLIILDTVRADHMGCYGYSRSTTPSMDRLAEEAVVFDSAIAQSSWTVPSIASLFTGLYPTRHQALTKRSRLPDRRETLAEALRDSGYRTAAFVSHNLGSSRFNMGQGFDEFDETHAQGTRYVSSRGVSDLAVEWLRGNEDTPFFLLLHYFDPHYPYVFHHGYAFGVSYDGWLNPGIQIRDLRAKADSVGSADLAYLRGFYDGEIAFTDYHVGRVLEELQSLDLDRSTVVLITADHGEEFKEHGTFGHAQNLYEDLIRVPLILHHPRERDLPSRFGTLVEHVDVMPTLLDLLGIEWDGTNVDGASFWPALRGAAEPDSVAFSELSFWFAQSDPKYDEHEYRPNYRSVREGYWKLIYDVDTKEYELYDLEMDPGETNDLAAISDEKRFERLEGLLTDWMLEMERVGREENPSPDTVRVVDPRVEEKLKALGYVH